MRLELVADRARRSKPPDGSRLQLFDSYFERYASTCAPECVDCYKEIAFANGISPAALAIAFCDS